MMSNLRRRSSTMDRIRPLHRPSTSPPSWTSPQVRSCDVCVCVMMSELSPPAWVRPSRPVQQRTTTPIYPNPIIVRNNCGDHKYNWLGDVRGKKASKMLLRPTMHAHAHMYRHCRRAGARQIHHRPYQTTDVVQDNKYVDDTAPHRCR